jgi:hypothetical protein
MSPKERKDRKGEHRQLDVDQASDALDAIKKCSPPAVNDGSIAWRLFRSPMAGTPLSRIDIARYADSSERFITLGKDGPRYSARSVSAEFRAACARWLYLFLSYRRFLECRLPF